PARQSAVPRSLLFKRGTKGYAEERDVVSLFCFFVVRSLFCCSTSFPFFPCVVELHCFPHCRRCVLECVCVHVFVFVCVCVCVCVCYMSETLCVCVLYE